MGAIKDLVDLVTKLSDSVQDRKFAAELREIQRMIGGILSEHAELHESRIALMTENEKLKKEIPALQARIAKLEQENLKLLDPPHTEPPTEQDIELMRKLTNPNAKIPASSLSKSLNLSLPLLDYKADLMRSAGFIYVHHGDYELKYSLTKKGQKFLFDKGLLE
jgi:predicted transcriptional regulator